MEVLLLSFSDWRGFGCLKLFNNYINMEEGLVNGAKSLITVAFSILQTLMGQVSGNQ